MKKKKVCVLLSVIMTVVSLSACGSSSGGMDNATPPMDQADSYTNNAAPSAEQMDSAADNAGNASSNFAQTAAEEISFDTTATNAAADYAQSYDWNTEEYNAVEEPGFKAVANEPLSTFSADVDTASYSNIRRMIEDGYSMDEIPAGAVRIEEMLNYFSYDYKLPGKNEPFGVTTVIGDCPWNEDAKLLQIGF